MAVRCSGSLVTAVAVLCGSPTLFAQSTRVQDLSIGKVLVAHRDSRDPLFAETVILLVQYDHVGTLGLAINRRTDVPISRALPEFKGASKATRDSVYMGGPVQVHNVLALLRAANMPEGAAHVAGKVYLVSSKPLLEKMFVAGAESADLRVYLGYCGWGPGQLENETSHGFWHIFASDADLVFDSKPETLWSRLIARVGQNIALRHVPANVRVEPGYLSFLSP
jgi:putative transcriptional regulator